MSSFTRICSLLTEWILVFLTCGKSERQDKEHPLLGHISCKGALQGVTPGLAHVSCSFCRHQLWRAGAGRGSAKPAGSYARGLCPCSYLAAGGSATTRRAFPAVQTRSKHSEREERAGTRGAHEACLCASLVGGDVNFPPVRESDS